MRVDLCVRFLAVVLSFSAAAAAWAEKPESDDPFAATAGGEDSSAARRSGRSTRRGAATPPSAARPEVRRIWIDSDPAATERILAALDKPLSGGGLDFVDTPLEEVVAFLRDEYGVEIQIDRREFDALGLSPDEPVTVSVSRAKLGAALRLMLDPLELTYSVADGVLTITTREAAAARLTTAVYSVDDLADEWSDYQQLIKVVTRTVAPDAWTVNGGGDAEIHPFPMRGAIVVRQSHEAHRDLAALLSGLAELTPRRVGPADAQHAGHGAMGMGGTIGMGGADFGRGIARGRGAAGRRTARERE